MATTAKKTQDEFISMASHELKTPVTSLKGFLSLLQRRLVSQGDEKALYYLLFHAALLQEKQSC